MEINRENYEAFLLDLMEGQLSLDQEKVLMGFLSENSDLAADTDLLEFILPATRAFFPLKEGIRKGVSAGEISEDNYEQFCIARLEGDLPDSVSKALDAFLSENPEFARASKLFDLILLREDKTVRFPYKHRLRKRIPAIKQLSGYFRQIGMHRTVSIAASVAILLSASVFIRNYYSTDQTFLLDRDIFLPADTLPADGSPDEPATAIQIDPFESENSYQELPSGSAVGDYSESPAGDYFPREPGLPQPPVRHSEAKLQIEKISGSHVKPVQVAELYRTPQTSYYQEERQVSGTIIKGVTGFIARITDRESERERLTLLDLANAGFRGVNSLAGTNLHLEREYNQDGDIVKTAFNSGIIDFHRTTKIIQD